MITPAYVIDPVRELLGGIGLDPCTEPDNPVGALRYYSLPVDGCSQSWEASSVWVNPPYGAARERWVERCVGEALLGRRIVLLIPAAIETRICQRALRACQTVVMIKARLRFEERRANGRRMAASHGSALFGFNVDLSPLHGLGVVLKPSGGGE